MYLVLYSKSALRDFQLEQFSHKHKRKLLTKKTKEHQCKVLFDYYPQNKDELELTVGYIIDVIKEVEEAGGVEP